MQRNKLIQLTTVHIAIITPIAKFVVFIHITRTFDVIKSYYMEDKNTHYQKCTV